MRRHFKKLTYFAVALCMMGVIVSPMFAFSAGPPNGRTGSPADNFKTCKDIGCHNTYELNSGEATFSISAPGDYTLGEVVPITIFFNNSDTQKHGFELSALDADNNRAGTFSPVDGLTQTDDGKGYYIKHTATGSRQSGNTSWSVLWTAPSSEVKNPVTFYATGNEANGNGSNDGDYIYKITREISQLAATPIPTVTPTLTATPTPPECETELISVSLSELELQRQESEEVVVALVPAEGCPPEEGALVTAKVRPGRKRVSVSPQSATTDANGEAKFTITAKKNGKAKVKFKYENLKATVKVRVVK